MIKHYAFLIRPISVIAHLVILNLVLITFNGYENHAHLLYINFAWLVTAFFSGIYFFHRTITVTKVVQQLLIQFSIFTLLYFVYYALKDLELPLFFSIKLLTLIFIGITLFRILYFTALRRYRLGGRNYKRVVLLGSNTSLKPLANFMMNRSDFGYKILGYFSNQSNSELNYKPTDRALINEDNGYIPFLGSIDKLQDYSIDNNIDEIYCSLSEIKEETLKEIIDFGDSQVIKIKLVPDSNDFITKNLKLDYYGFLPVFSLRNFPLDKPFARYSKRAFDIVFSVLIIVFVLSWLTPLLYIFIKLDSKGSVFFKQEREGLKGENFVCYKYRSMDVNNRSDLDQTTKNDERITRVGRFIRKTSIDELPQFFNVLKGEMSVVGPRPHMPNQSKSFKKIVNKYMVRHFIKPGITGLAQIRGFRGEIESDNDIKQRVDSDIFYLENWSFVMDISIILKTIIKTIKGDENAY